MIFAFFDCLFYPPLLGVGLFLSSTILVGLGPIQVMKVRKKKKMEPDCTLDVLYLSKQISRLRNQILRYEVQYLNFQYIKT